MRAIEAERARLNLSEADAAMDTGQVLRIQQFITLGDADKNNAGTQLQGSFHRLGQSARVITLRDYEAVDNGFDRVLLVSVKRELL